MTRIGTAGLLAFTFGLASFLVLVGHYGIGPDWTDRVPPNTDKLVNFLAGVMTGGGALAIFGTRE